MMTPAPLSLSALQDRVRAGERFTYRYFYGHTPRGDGRLSNAVFSQFYPSQFEIDGRAYAWAEQWMMACKARLFGDDQALLRILNAPTPNACKKIGREVRGFDDALWNDKRFAVVLSGSLAKFRQDPDLRRFLMDTGDEILVEAAPRDRVWGIGLGRDHTDARNPLKWRGQNLLGFALVHAREVLRDRLPEPEPLDLSG